MQYIKGDILSGIDPKKRTVILHGCNCFHKMGAGIAKYLSLKFPDILIMDQTQTKYADEKKLGHYTGSIVMPGLTILNCYTQYHYGTRFGVPVNYPAIEHCLQRVSDIAKHFDDIRAPRIGCGLAGGNWATVEKLFMKHLPQVTIYYL